MGQRRDREVRLREILEACFYEQEKGEPVEIGELCQGDTDLEEEVRRLLEEAPGALAPEPPTREPAPPHGPDRRVIGDFLLEEEIGRGGMGTVYRAKQITLGRTVAVKILQSRPWADPIARLRFQREAELTAALAHPNIAPVYAVGEAEGVPYLAMRLLEGPSLDRIELPLSAKDVAYIGSQVARALHAAHLAGIVHRDVKPGNILLDDGIPYVVDFGLARSFGESELTKSNVIPGTLPYLAPEELDTPETPPSPSTDVYALGATLYELLSGERAFRGSDSASLVRRILLEDPDPLRLARKDLDLEVIVHKALEKSPVRRFRDAQELALELERFLEGRPILSRRVGLLGRLERLVRRHPTATAMVGIALAIALGFATLALNARLDRSARIQREIAKLENQLSTQAWTEAGVTLERLRSDHAPLERIEGHARQQTAELALERLLDDVLDLRESISLTSLGAALSAVERHPETSRPRAKHQASLLAEHLLGRTESARTRLRDVAFPVDQAIRCIVEERSYQAGEETESRDTAAEAGDEAALLRILRATALHLLEAPVETELAEIESLLRSPDLPAHTRARAHYAKAVALTRSQRSAETEPLLQLLAMEPGSPPKVWRTLAMVRRQKGDSEGAFEALAKIPEEQRTPNDALMELTIAGQESDLPQFQSQLAKALERWPAAPGLLLAEAEYLATIENEYDRALELVEGVATPDEILRGMQSSSRATIEFLMLQRNVEGLGSERRYALRAFAQDAIDMAAGMTQSRSRGQMEWAAGRALAEAGDFKESLAPLGRAERDLRSTAGPLVDAVSSISRLVGNRAGSPADIQAWQHLAVRKSLKLLELWESNSVWVVTEDLDQTLRIGMSAAEELADIESCLRLTEAYSQVTTTPAASVREKAEDLSERMSEILPTSLDALWDEEEY